MTHKHTPGPWGVGLWHGTVSGTVTGRVFEGAMPAVFYEGGMIAPMGPQDDPESWPNARLIAAAPELYAVCEALDDFICNELAGDTPLMDFCAANPEASELLLKARAAIAKATGDAS